MFSTLISQKKRDLFGSLLAYSYLCKRSLARYSSVNAGVTFVGKKRKHSIIVTDVCVAWRGHDLSGNSGNPTASRCR